jgi:hypothetical protein
LGRNIWPQGVRTHPLSDKPRKKPPREDPYVGDLLDRLDRFGKRARDDVDAGRTEVVMAGLSLLRASAFSASALTERLDAGSPGGRSRRVRPGQHAGGLRLVGGGLLFGGAKNPVTKPRYHFRDGQMQLQMSCNKLECPYLV